MMQHLSENLKAIKSQIAGENYLDGYRALVRLAVPEHPFPAQQRIARLMRRIPPASVGLRPMKLALLAECSLEHFADILQLWAAIKGIALDVWVAPFGTVEQTILDPNSELYRFRPDVTWIFNTYRDTNFGVPPGATVEEAKKAVAAAVGQVSSLWEKLREGKAGQVLFNTADIPSIDVFGNFEANVLWGRRSLLRAFNLGLAEARPSGVTLFDLDHVAGLYGKRRWEDSRYWHHSKHAFSFEANGLIAHEAASVLAAMVGLSKKCLVTDLDNTLWGGVVADDGVEGIRLGLGAEGEAFMELQAYLKALKERGIILAVSSKNNDLLAKEPFNTHPDMRLSLDDIAVFRANWNNKADNIRDIAETLNIGLDSIVFIDDNPAERALVAAYLPMVEIPQLPDDPAGYLSCLARHNYFDVVSFGDEDRQRASYYKHNAQRKELANTFTDTSEYLRSLEMVGEIGIFDRIRIARVAQLIGKSNQFHLTGTRYSEAQISSMVEDAAWHGRWFGLRDRFGDNGLISAVILERRPDQSLHIDTWVMSCRVLARGMEEFICNEIVRVARSQNCNAVTGCYVPSKKNGLVAGLYSRLGFLQTGDDEGRTEWRLDLSSFENHPAFILRQDVSCGNG